MWSCPTCSRLGNFDISVCSWRGPDTIAVASSPWRTDLGWDTPPRPPWGGVVSRRTTSPVCAHCSPTAHAAVACALSTHAHDPCVRYSLARTRLCRVQLLGCCVGLRPNCTLCSAPWLLYGSRTQLHAVLSILAVVWASGPTARCSQRLGCCVGLRPNCTLCSAPWLLYGPQGPINIQLAAAPWAGAIGQCRATFGSQSRDSISQLHHFFPTSLPPSKLGWFE